MFEMNKILRTKAKKLLKPEEDPGLEIEEEVPEKQQPIQGTDRQEESERNLVRMLLLHGDKVMKFQVVNEFGLTEIHEKYVAQYIFNELDADGLKFSNKGLARIFDACRIQSEADGVSNTSRILNMLDPNTTNISADIMNSLYALSPNWQKKHGIFVSHTENDSAILISEVESAILEFKHLVLVHRMDEIRHELQSELSEEDQMIKVHEFQMLKTIDVEIEKKIRQRVISS